MIDIVLAALSAALLAFLTLFIISFVTLGLIAGVVHLIATGYRSLVDDKTAAYREQTV